ncbi:MAG: YfhO family protein [Flavipsychrobacter sp.]|nr:YfhO family protein [Flavipsychrobacter sp.]
MPSFDFKKDLLPHLLIVAGLALFALIYSYPALQGKVLYQHDNVSWKSMAHEAMDYAEKHPDEEVYWSNSMFGGMPSYTHYMAPSKNYISQIEKAIQSVLPKPAYFFFIAMLGFYILMHVLRVNRWLGVIGAVAYAFASYNPQIIAAGHETKMLSVGYMPAVMAGILLLYRGKYLSGAALTGIALGLMAGNAHWQMVYYLLIVILFMVVALFVLAIREGKLKQFFIASGIALAVSALGAGTNMQALLSTMEYSKHTMRGGQSELTAGHDANKKSGGLDKDYAFRWSLGMGETFCLLIPDLYGGASEPIGPESKTYEKAGEVGIPPQGAEQISYSFTRYWGNQTFLSGPVYFGAIICLLFVLSLFVIRSPHKWWMAAVSLLAIMMAWGSNFSGFNYFLFDNLPGLNKFRTPTIILTIPQLLFPVMGIWALNDIITEKISGAELWKKVKVSVLIVGGLCLVLGVFGSMFYDYKTMSVVGASGETRDDMVKKQLTEAMGGNSGSVNSIYSAVLEDRAGMARKSGLTSLFFVVAAGAVLWAFSQKKIKANALLVVIGVLVLADLVPQANRYLNEERNYKEESEYEAEFSPRPVDAQILADPDPYYRVLDMTTDPYNDAVPAYHHKLIGGYHPAKLEMYQDLIDQQMNGSKFNGQVLNMLNTKYLITQGQNGPAAQQNPGAMGNAWFVNEIKWVASADEEMSSLDAPNIGTPDTTGRSFNAANTAVVRNTFKDKLGSFVPGKDSTARVVLDKYGLNNISYKSQNSKEGFAVFSDIYYPNDWHAYIDGNEVPIVRTNYVLRGLKIPAGSHSIEFKFVSKGFRTGGTVAMLSSFLLFGLGLVAIAMAVRNKEPKKEA